MLCLTALAALTDPVSLMAFPELRNLAPPCSRQSRPRCWVDKPAFSLTGANAARRDACVLFRAWRRGRGVWELEGVPAQTKPRRSSSPLLHRRDRAAASGKHSLTSLLTFVETSVVETTREAEPRGVTRRALTRLHLGRLSIHLSWSPHKLQFVETVGKRRSLEQRWIFR